MMCSAYVIALKLPGHSLIPSLHNNKVSNTESQPMRYAVYIVKVMPLSHDGRPTQHNYIEKPHA